MRLRPRETARKRPPATLPAEVVRELRRPQLTYLATASARGRPATTLISWLYAVDARRVLVVLDRRGLAFRHVTENAHAALEVVLRDFTASVRGRTTVVAEEMSVLRFGCAVVLLELEEIRDHSVAGVTVVPGRYRFAVGREAHAVAEVAVFDELAELGARLRR